MSDVEIRRAGERAVTRTEWLRSSHSFSFGPHYDPTNLSFGLLQVHNDDLVAPHSGYDTHAHREMEIVTWLISGELTHTDSAGHSAVLRRGQVQRMTAGTGVRHSERNEGDVPARFVQVWVSPEREGLAPEHSQADVSSLLGGGGLVAVVSGLSRDAGHVPLTLHQSGAAFSVARLEAGQSVEVPVAPFVHVYVAVGSIAFGDETLAEGDALRLSGRGGRSGRLEARTASEILVWEMHSTAVAP